jgi:hypothetical protein
MQRTESRKSRVLSPSPVLSATAKADTDGVFHPTSTLGMWAICLMQYMYIGLSYVQRSLGISFARGFRYYEKTSSFRAH